MAVITISRGSYSAGTLIARGLAGRLDLRVIDRDVLVARAAEYGVSPESLRDALDKPPGFWDRIRHTKYAYLTLIQAALTEEARGGSAVYHGHAGHLLLRGVSHVVRARIIAPMAFRLAMVQDRLGLRGGEAAAYIARMDENRRRWTQDLYGLDWGDPALYDVVVNLESLDIDQACAVIAATAGQRCFEETTESRAALEDLALGSRVRASLVAAPETSDAELEVAAHAGRVVIRGDLHDLVLARDVERVAAQVPGVEHLALEPCTELGA